MSASNVHDENSRHIAIDMLSQVLEEEAKILEATVVQDKTPVHVSRDGSGSKNSFSQDDPFFGKDTKQVWRGKVSNWTTPQQASPLRSKGFEFSAAAPAFVPGTQGPTISNGNRAVASPPYETNARAYAVAIVWVPVPTPTHTFGSDIQTQHAAPSLLPLLAYLA